MNQKQYLTEENYEREKKKIKQIALLILILGVTIGLGLIVAGAILSHNTESVKVDLNSNNENKNTLRSEDEVQADINSITPKINTLNREIQILEMNLASIQFSEGTSDNYTTKLKEKETKESELLDLEAQLKKYKSELSEIKNANSNNEMDKQIDQFENVFNGASNKIAKAKYTPFYLIGGFILFASCLISLAIYIFTKKREIAAFTVQQTMPIAQEGIEKMAPTVGNAFGTIAKDIKEGINEANNNKE